MRRAAAVLAVAVLAAGCARSDPAPDAVGDDVQAALQSMKAGQTESGRATLDRMARGGRADAAEALGEVTQLGWGGLKSDPALACEYFGLAAKQRGDGLHNLALCHELGVVGGKPDLARAATLYQQAADKGYAKSKCALGNLYRLGRGVPRDEPRGIALCRETAEAGVADAQTDMGIIYLTGQGVPKDAAEGRAWLEKAAAQDQRNALYTLGQIYWNGDGVAKDNAKAADYWRRSYAAGRRDAAKQLGDEAFVRAAISQTEWSTPALQEALDWYAKAADAEDPALAAQAAKQRQMIATLRDALLRPAAKN